MEKKWKEILAVKIFLLLLVVLAYKAEYKISADALEFYVSYGEYHANIDGGTSQLFYASEGGGRGFQMKNLCCVISMEAEHM